MYVLQCLYMWGKYNLYMPLAHFVFASIKYRNMSKSFKNVHAIRPRFLRYIISQYNCIIMEQVIS